MLETDKNTVYFAIDKKFFVKYIIVKGVLGKCVPGRKPKLLHRARGTPYYFKEVIIMDTGNIVSLISSVGFPIVACIALFWQLNKTNEMHREEMNMIKDSIDELRAAIQLLTQRLNIN